MSELKSAYCGDWELYFSSILRVFLHNERASSLEKTKKWQFGRDGRDITSEKYKNWLFMSIAYGHIVFQSRENLSKLVGCDSRKFIFYSVFPQNFIELCSWIIRIQQLERGSIYI